MFRNKTSPIEGFSILARIFNKVDFPEPYLPVIEMSPLDGNDKLTFLSASKLLVPTLNDLVRLWITKSDSLLTPI